MVDLDELAGLVAQMTGGKWEHASAGHGEGSSIVVDEYFVRREEDDVAIAADIIDPDTCKASEANAAGIAALRNAAEELIRDARRWREVDALMSNSGAEMSINSGGWALLKHAMEAK